LHRYPGKLAPLPLDFLVAPSLLRLQPRELGARRLPFLAGSDLVFRHLRSSYQARRLMATAPGPWKLWHLQEDRPTVEKSSPGHGSTVISANGHLDETVFSTGRGRPQTHGRKLRAGSSLSSTRPGNDGNRRPA